MSGLDRRWLSECRLCPRECGVDRELGGTGFCGETAVLRAARAALHFWEEPCVSGERGSGTVFFTGCTMGCVFCQNREIATGTVGQDVSVERLAEIFLELQEQGAHNVNLVTPTHMAVPITEALGLAREQGLTLPVVYNTSGYERVEILRELEPFVDVYLPDFKYMEAETARKYSKAPDYFERASEALAEMVRQKGPAVFDEEGMMIRGVLVRHLVLPGHTTESKNILSYLHETYGDTIYISMMNQYTPMPDASEWPNLRRKLTPGEYKRVTDHAWKIGIRNGFIQEGETAEASFIPPFSGEGL